MTNTTYKLQNTIMEDYDSLFKAASEYFHINNEGRTTSKMMINEGLSHGGQLMELRLGMQELGMYALVTNDWVKELAKFLEDKKVLEVMCGRGWLSKALKDNGIEIISTDAYKSHLNWTTELEPLVDIENLTAVKSVKKYHEDVDYIIMSWAPYDKPVAYNVIQKLKELNSNAKVIFIGEGAGGCTADFDFYDSIDVVQDDKFRVVEDAYDKVVSANGLAAFTSIKDLISIVEPK